MSHSGNDAIIDRKRDEGTTDGLTPVSEILPQVLDDEGIRIHSTDDDTPTVGRVTVEPVDTDFMDSPLVRGLRDLTRKIDELR